MCPSENAVGFSQDAPCRIVASYLATNIFDLKANILNFDSLEEFWMSAGGSDSLPDLAIRRNILVCGKGAEVSGN
jgi:hypothetical protein